MGVIVATLYGLGEKLQKGRKNKGLVQKDVAEVLNVDTSMISHYETGVSMPTLESAVKMAALYDLSLDMLTGLSNRHLVSVDGLTDEQVTAIQRLIEDFRNANK